MNLDSDIEFIRVKCCLNRSEFLLRIFGNIFFNNMISIKPIDEISDKSETVQLKVWVIRQFLNVHEALFLEIFINLLLLLA